MIGTTAVLGIGAREGAAIGITVGLVLFGSLLILTALGDIRGRRKAKVPPAMRPGSGDEELESKVLVRYLTVGSITTLVMALWLPFYWFREPQRQSDKRAATETAALKHGEVTFDTFCVSCHGKGGTGATQQYLIRGQTRSYAEPPLKYIYSRYQLAGRSDEEITQLIRDAIERGRPGTPMPTWSLAYGGSLTSGQIDDLIFFIQDIQERFPEPKDSDGEALFLANCAVCHNALGPGGEALDPDDPRALALGGVGPNLRVVFERLSRQEIFDVIKHGRVNTNRPSMPAWAGLGDDAIEALVRYLQSIQRG